MTQGVVLFASNNDAISYTDIAEHCAVRVNRHLNKPVSLITSTADQIKNPGVFDNIISIQDHTVQQRKFRNGDLESTDIWKNFSRADAYSLTPYDETLVLDADYFLYTDVLNYCFDQPNDLVVARHSKDISFKRSNLEFQHIGFTQIDFYWATVFFFRKTAETQVFFDLVNHIKDNWTFYKHSYQFSSSLYRNDFSFALAAHILKGLVVDLPFPLHYVTDRDVVVSVNDDYCKVLLQKHSSDYIVSDIRNVDLHIMNKIALQELINV
jgi:hypothetical protein